MRICEHLLMRENQTAEMATGEIPVIRERLLYNSKEARELLGGISEPNFRRLTQSGELKAKKIGSYVYVEAEVLRAFIAQLPDAEKESA